MIVSLSQKCRRVLNTSELMIKKKYPKVTSNRFWQESFNYKISFIKTNLISITKQSKKKAYLDKRKWISAADIVQQLVLFVDSLDIVNERFTM